MKIECLLDRSIRRGEPVRRVGYGQRGGESTCSNAHTVLACDGVNMVLNMEELREAYCCSQRADRVSESKAPHLLNINVVVEMDQVSLLLLSLNLTLRKGRRQCLDGVACGGGGGTSRLRGGQCAAGANRNWTVVAISWVGGGYTDQEYHI